MTIPLSECVETLFPGIYYDSRYNEYLVSADYKGKVLSQKLLKIGTLEKDILHFSSFAQTMGVGYEIAKYKRSLETNPEIQKKLDEEIWGCLQNGRVDLPEYFGNYLPPLETPTGAPEYVREIRNGIFACTAGGCRYLAVCFPIQDCDLTIAAAEFGQIVRDFIFFDEKHIAIPLYELKKEFPEEFSEVVALINDDEQLLAYIWDQIPDYPKRCDELEELHQFPKAATAYNGGDLLSRDIWAE